jgi:peptide subunit release factor 1 (eRF1)
MTATPRSNPTIDQLSRLQTDEPEVISCYLQLDPPARFRRRYLVEVKQRAKDLLNHLEARAEARSLRERVSNDLDRLVEWLSAPERLPPLPGVAVFVSQRLGLFSVVPLPRVHRNRLALERFPVLHQLIDARETLGHYLAVLVDRNHGRFFDVSAGGVEELPGLAPRASRGGKYRSDRHDAPGWGEHDYQMRLRTEAQRHHAAIGDTVARTAQARPIAGIAILGPSEHCQGVAGFLPRSAAKLLLGVARLNPTAATLDQVARATWLLQGQLERQDEAKLVEDIEEGVPTGWATNGARDTLRALALGQVRTLVVPDPQTGGGYRCAATGRLVLAPSDCRGEGSPEPIVNLVDAAIDDALRQRADVVVVDDPDLIGRIEGLAAVLRFRARG